MKNQTIDRTLTQKQWNQLQYPINLRALTEEEGGGWFATIPLLGEATCAADGETVEEALANLEDYRRSLYEVVIACKTPIPFPTAVTEKPAKPAGKWLMRTSSELHQQLQKGASETGVSFNTYCIECLSRGFHAEAAENAVRLGIEDLKTAFAAEITDQVRDEMRLQGQKLVAELAFARAQEALAEAHVQYEPPATSRKAKRGPSMREKVNDELARAA